MIDRPTKNSVWCKPQPIVKEMDTRAVHRVLLGLLILISLVCVGPGYGVEDVFAELPELEEDLFADLTESEEELPNFEGLSPSDVLVRVNQVQGELELIRFEMGKPKVGKAHVSVTHAMPREAYFQAITLLEKTDRLAFEQTGELGDEWTKIHPENIRPKHVWKMVNAALHRVREAKEMLGITKSAVKVPSRSDATLTDVFQAIVVTNRQLNLMLAQQFAPQDVYRQVTLAIHYTAKLLAHVPDAKRIPDARPFEHGKIPADVFARLLECFDRVAIITRQSGLEVLDLDQVNIHDKQIKPSDVYDIASLIVSDLVYVHSQLPGARVPNQSFGPGRKFPSHVYQRAGILLDQLHILEQYVQTTPHWLQG